MGLVVMLLSQERIVVASQCLERTGSLRVYGTPRPCLMCPSRIAITGYAASLRPSPQPPPSVPRPRAGNHARVVIILEISNPQASRSLGCNALNVMVGQMIVLGKKGTVPMNNSFVRDHCARPFPPVKHLARLSPKQGSAFCGLPRNPHAGASRGISLPTRARSTAARPIPFHRRCRGRALRSTWPGGNCRVVVTGTELPSGRRWLVGWPLAPPVWPPAD